MKRITYKFNACHHVPCVKRYGRPENVIVTKLLISSIIHIFLARLHACMRWRNKVRTNALFYVTYLITQLLWAF